MVFTVLTLSQMGHVLAIRSESESLFQLGLWSNRAAARCGGPDRRCCSSPSSTCPAPNPVFKTQPLGAGELILCLALSSVTFFAVELGKWWTRRRRRRHSA